MPKAQKATKKTAAKSAASTKSTASKSAASKSTASKKVATPVQTPAPEPVVESTSTDPSLSDEFSEFMANLTAVRSQLSTLATQFRALQKRSERELKAAQKLNSKRKRKTGNRSPSGFVKPTLNSDELATFLGKPSGSEMARTEVTREINAYIRENSLQDKENGRKINADSALSKLLKLKKSDELTYFNLQRYMSPHFAKAGNPTPQADSSS